MNPTTMTVSLRITDPGAIADLSPLGDAERSERAVKALTIGLVALRSVSGQLDAEAIKNTCDGFMTKLDNTLGLYRERTGQVLKEYLGKEGLLPQDLTRLTRPGGDLDKAITAAGAATLQTFLAGLKPVLAVFDPATKDNLVELMRSGVYNTIAEHRDEVLRQFSLDAPGSAINRLLTQVREANGELSGELRDKVTTVLDQLSLDEEASAMSRLRRDLFQTLEAEHQANTAFRLTVETALATLTATKAEAARSTSHGVVFEDRLCSLVAEYTSTFAVGSSCGTTTGRIKNCKIGDYLFRLDGLHAAGGGRVVIEAKESASYTLLMAQDEVAQARVNREADTGLFVFSTKTRPKELTRDLVRIGDKDVICVWDQDDPRTDVYLFAGIQLAVALIAKDRSARSAEAADFAKLDAAILSLEKELSRSAQVKTWVETIQNNSVKVLDEVRKGSESITKQVGNLRDAVEALR